MNAAELLAAKQLREHTLNILVGGEPVPLTFRALPRKQYRALLEEHPGDENTDWNPDTFCPALIAACSVEPVFKPEQALQLWEEWEDVEAARVFLACFNLNENPAGLGFTWPGFATTDDSGQNSNTADPKESPTPSS